jgi:hypothetical protein
MEDRSAWREIDLWYQTERRLVAMQEAVVLVSAGNWEPPLLSHPARRLLPTPPELSRLPSSEWSLDISTKLFLCSTN